MSKAHETLLGQRIGRHEHRCLQAVDVALRDLPHELGLLEQRGVGDSSRVRTERVVEMPLISAASGTP